MNSERTVFSQILDFLPKYEFNKCVNRYRGSYKVQTFSCFDQFLCMAYAQLTHRESLRDIESCLRAMRPKLYHAGFRGKISRSTLADANEKRDWRIYADFANILIGIARKLYADEDFGLELEQTVYALDSTTIDLCLSLFPWARFRKHKGAVKLHTLLDLRGNIPTLVVITHGRVHDVNILDDLLMEPGAIYVMDRGYLDFSRLFAIHQSAAYFVTRARKKLILSCSGKIKKCRDIVLQGAMNDGTIEDWQLGSCKSLFEWILYGLSDQRIVQEAFETGLEGGKNDEGLFDLKINKL